MPKVSILICISDKLIYKNGMVNQCIFMQPDCLNGRVVCGTVYGDMHLKDLL